MSFNLYFVRHGQTIFNHYERMQGWSNAPLTDKGISDGYAAGDRLENIRFDAAYSSDLQRAIQTAEFVLSRNKQSGDLKTPEQLQQFREQFFGFFEGLPSKKSSQLVAEKNGLENMETYNDLMTNLTQDEVMDAMHVADPTGDAEDAQMFWARVDKGMELLRRNTRDGQNILVVSHGTLIRNLVAKYGSHEQAAEKPENGSITIFEVSDEDMKLKVYNDTTTKW
ncbi:histidine phosphatase family protein [Weissella bombi]|uniref:Probable phosphoglycerate mutase n=1 Tax=Weissella bombi TaxID=1505725 RepID=A0A1C4BZA0_9LACO|nr:histidine phosphatase family protein [Weissella bombi]SCC12053.1 probable phosphoglycerate mutase [Weissella bombi]